MLPHALPVQARSDLETLPAPQPPAEAGEQRACGRGVRAPRAPSTRSAPAPLLPPVTLPGTPPHSGCSQGSCGCCWEGKLGENQLPRNTTPASANLFWAATWAALTFLNWFTRFVLYFLALFNVHAIFLAPKEDQGRVPKDQKWGSKQPAGSAALRHHLVIMSLFIHANFINIIYIFKAIYK